MKTIRRILIYPYLFRIGLNILKRRGVLISRKIRLLDIVFFPVVGVSVILWWGSNQVIPIAAFVVLYSSIHLYFFFYPIWWHELTAGLRAIQEHRYSYIYKKHLVATRIEMSRYPERNGRPAHVIGQDEYGNRWSVALKDKTDKANVEAVRAIVLYFYGLRKSFRDIHHIVKRKAR